MMFFISLGDLLPVIRMSGELRSRGYNVIIMGPSWAKQVVDGYGFEFRTFVDEEAELRVRETETLHDPNHGLKAPMTHIYTPIMRKTYDFVRDTYEPGKNGFVAFPGYFGARLAQEAHDIPLLTLYYAPYFVKTFCGFSAEIMDPLLLPKLNPLREEIGLQPLESDSVSWMHSRTGGLALFPEWLSSREPEWPEKLTFTDFILPEVPVNPGFPPDFAAFLEAGEKPILFTPGTFLERPAEYLRTCIDACRQMGKRGILACRYEDQVPPLDENFYHITMAPFQAIMPLVSAVVFHGGIGTMAEALRAGIPQVVKPTAYDQFDNGRIVEELNVGRLILPDEFDAAHLVDALTEVMTSETIAQGCRDMQQKVMDSKGTVKAADAIEKTFFGK